MAKKPMKKYSEKAEPKKEETKESKLSLAARKKVETKERKAYKK